MKFKLLPYTKLKVGKQSGELVLNKLTDSYIKFECFHLGEYLEIIISSKRKKEVSDILRTNNIEVFSLVDVGLLTKMKKFNRIGLIFGALLILLFVYFSSKVVWKIEIDGNERLSDNEVEKILNESGLFYGKYIPSINYDKLHNEILLKNKEISWISVNINGNVAYVSIKENQKTHTDSEYYSNIVAGCDAQVVEVRVKNGEQVIKINDIVKEGELLISGVIDSKSQGVRYEKANGEILGRTIKEISLSFPYKGKEKIYTGKIFTEKKIKIFSKVINFSLKSNKNLEFYDKIEENKQISLFGKYKLPIFVENTKYLEYQMVDIEYSKRQAVDLLFKDLSSMLAELTKEAELVSKNVETSYDENGIYITCKLECIENIAKEVRIFKE